MKNLTRRELFKEICSRDSLRTVFRAWNDFAGGYRENRAEKESVGAEDGELLIKESFLRLAQNKQKRLQSKKISIRKEGNKS